MERYDYGKEENLKKYGSEYPPVYDYDTYKTWDIDTFITFTEADPFSSYDDVYKETTKRLKNKKFKKS